MTSKPTGRPGRSEAAGPSSTTKASPFGSSSLSSPLFTAPSASRKTERCSRIRVGCWSGMGGRKSCGDRNSHPTHKGGVGPLQGE